MVRSPCLPDQSQPAMGLAAKGRKSPAGLLLQELVAGWFCLLGGVDDGRMDRRMDGDRPLRNAPGALAVPAAPQLDPAPRETVQTELLPGFDGANPVAL